MERFCDEVLQLIFYELEDPGPLTLVSQRFNRFSQDPYVRAHYFLTHYGPIEAMYYALGRGKVVTERVLDILLSSGVHLSRYLIQIAIHHYFHTQSHFIKTQWVRNVPLRVFTYFLKIAEEKYGEIPRGKGEDDGSVFSIFLKESRMSTQMKSITWETIRELMDTYKFIPFCHRDPLTPQFPLALAIEPRLLPHAIANGFSMDYKYRDFVFRKMFERPSASSETRAEDIAENARELCKLDPAMFLSRTVAAEVCMEAKLNEIGYSALKQLDKSGHLRFELSTLVEDLLRTFLTTRSITSITTGDVLLQLFMDYPTSDVTVRLVVLIIVFTSAETLHMAPLAIRAKLENLGMMPMTRRDVFNILVNPFVERYTSLLEFAQKEVGINEDGTKGMGAEDIEKVVQEVAARCMEIACKGKLVKKLHEGFPTVKTVITNLVLSKYQINVEDLPSWEDGLDYGDNIAKLCRDFCRFGLGEVHSLESLMPEEHKVEPMDTDTNQLLQVDLPPASTTSEIEGTASKEDRSISDLGDISQESLTAMIRQDESVPVRSRRRMLFSFSFNESAGKLRYPHDPLHIGRWAKHLFGHKSAVAAVFMTHAVLNDNCTLIHNFIMGGTENGSQVARVPVTFKHFQLLARLGRPPNFYLWHLIETGADFYADENDYLSKSEQAKILSARQNVKVEASNVRLPSPSNSNIGSSTNSRSKKRPRRSAAVTVGSYMVPDSDDEAIIEDRPHEEEKKTRRESNLQIWIKHLSILLKVETRKFTERKRRLEKVSEGETKIRVQRNEFVKSLTTNLRTLRKLELVQYHGEDVVDEYSDNEDDEEFKLRRPKKRKVTHT